MKAIILAGGSGSRLWPLSRDLYPKQLLNFGNEKSLLQQTFARVNNFANENDIVTVTNVANLTNIKLQLNNKGIIIAEPQGKNTAPAIASALKYFEQSSNDDTVIIVPSDSLIKNNKAFNDCIKKAENLALKGYIVTLGVKPAYPETGYGYIKAGEKLDIGYRVNNFSEKPDIETVNEYVKNENYYWNSGIIISKISTLINEYKKYQPQITNMTSKLDLSINRKISFDLYEPLEPISIDYAIMEKTDKLALIKLESDWLDIGSWKSLYEVKQKDNNGNVTEGKVITENVKNSFIYSQKEVIAVSDLENIILVETEDAIMACKMDKSQNVKKLYEKLKSNSSDLTKLHKTVFRPWGYYTCMNEGEGYLTKTICVLPHQKLSIQSHNHRSEHWVVLEGKALVIKDEKEYHLNNGDSIDIPVRAKHSLQNPYDEELKIIEVQKGEYISEDDIIRYEDIYGRI